MPASVTLTERRPPFASTRSMRLSGTEGPVGVLGVEGVGHPETAGVGHGPGIGEAAGEDVLVGRCEEDPGDKRPVLRSPAMITGKKVLAGPPRSSVPGGSWRTHSRAPTPCSPRSDLRRREAP